MYPTLFQTESLTVPTYLVINSLIFCFGIFWIYRRSKLFNLSQNAALDLSLVAMMGAFIGSRSFHIFFERPEFYFHNPSFIFKVWYGGFVYYGGFFVALLFCFLLCLRRHYDFRAYADVFAPVLALGNSVGRLGCLLAGCCFGRPTTLPWGIKFPFGVEAPPGIELHPTQIYSSLWEGLIFIVLIVLERRRVFKRASGHLFGLWLLFHAVGRAIIEQFRGDFRGATPFNLSLSTWLSGLALFIGIYLLSTKRNTNASTAS